MSGRTLICDKTSCVGATSTRLLVAGARFMMVVLILELLTKVIGVAEMQAFLEKIGGVVRYCPAPMFDPYTVNIVSLWMAYREVNKIDYIPQPRLWLGKPFVGFF